MSLLSYDTKDKNNNIVVCSCFTLFYCSRLDSANVGGHVGGGGLGIEPLGLGGHWQAQPLPIQWRG
jgi:hypothetical protein